MDEQSKNAAIPGQSVTRKTVTVDEKTASKQQGVPLMPRAGTLSSLRPIESTKYTGQTVRETPEGMLKQLLMSTEASAERTQSSKRKWQFASLILAMMLIPIFLITGWLYLEMNVTKTQRGRLQMENQALKEQLNTADTQIAGFQDERQTLLNQNIELANENIKLKSQIAQTIAAVPAQAVRTEQKFQGLQVTSKSDEFKGQAIDAGRVEAMRKGTYPKGAARAELIAVLGEPDRNYKARGYEQLVYFGRKPGRFWLIGNWLVETSE